MDKVRVAIIGAGGIARFGHAPNYLNYKEKAELVAVCDNMKPVAEEAARIWGVKKVYTDYHDILKDDEVDAVDICLPHYLHASVAIEAAENGKHVAVQKPFSMKVTEADAMIQAANKAGVILMHHECEVFYPPHMKAKELIYSGEIGDTIIMRMAFKGGTDPIARMEREREREKVTLQQREELAKRNWRADRLKAGGGRLFDGGWHKFALARYLMGDVEEVIAWFNDPQYKTYGSEIPATVMWRYKERGKSGGIRYGQMDCTSSPNMYIYQERRAPEVSLTDITGTNGMIWITRSEGQIVKTAPVIMYKGEYPGKTVYFDNVPSEYIEGFKGMTHHFIDCILEKRKPLWDGEEGKKTLQFVLAVYKSAEENGKPVKPDSITDWKWPWEQG